jgi:hypothetical protein
MNTRRIWLERKPQGLWALAFFCLSAAVLCSGCAHVKELGKEVWGTSIQHLERARPDARIVIVKKAKHDTFVRAAEILKAQGANVYLTGEDDAYLAAMNFSGNVNTTQVGLFFTPVDEGATKIEVASLSPRLANVVAGMLSEGFQEKPKETAAP